MARNHATDGGASAATAEVRCPRCEARDSDTSRASSAADQGRKSRPAWRAARDAGATVLASVVGTVRGAASAWASRLNVDPKVTARFLHEEGHSPHLADLLVLDRELRVSLWRALLKQDTADANQPALSAERHLMLLGAEVGDVNREVIEALRDGRISPGERGRIVREIDEAMSQLAAMKRDLEKQS